MRGLMLTRASGVHRAVLLGAMLAALAFWVSTEAPKSAPSIDLLSGLGASETSRAGVDAALPVTPSQRHAPAGTQEGIGAVCADCPEQVGHEVVSFPARWSDVNVRFAGVEPPEVAGFVRNMLRASHIAFGAGDEGGPDDTIQVRYVGEDGRVFFLFQTAGEPTPAATLQGAASGQWLIDGVAVRWFQGSDRGGFVPAQDTGARTIQVVWTLAGQTDRAVSFEILGELTLVEARQLALAIIRP